MYKYCYSNEGAIYAKGYQLPRIQHGCHSLHPVVDITPDLYAGRRRFESCSGLEFAFFSRVSKAACKSCTSVSLCF